MHQNKGVFVFIFFALGFQFLYTLVKVCSPFNREILEFTEHFQPYTVHGVLKGRILKCLPFPSPVGVGDGQGSLACCSPWGHKESDRTEPLN